MEAIKQAALEAVLQAMKDVYSLRLVVIEWVIESLRLFMDEKRERRQ